MAEKELTSEIVLQMNSFIRDYHDYQEIWTAEMAMNRTSSTIEYNAAAIVSKTEGRMSRRKCIHHNELNGKTVLGHNLKLVVLLLTKFLKRPTNKVRAAVKGKCVNRRVVYGLEIPCGYFFKGEELSTSQWLKSKLEKQGFSFHYRGNKTKIAMFKAQLSNSIIKQSFINTNETKSTPCPCWS